MYGSHWQWLGTDHPNYRQTDSPNDYSITVFMILWLLIYLNLFHFMRNPLQKKNRSQK